MIGSVYMQVYLELGFLDTVYSRMGKHHASAARVIQEMERERAELNLEITQYIKKLEKQQAKPRAPVRAPGPSQGPRKRYVRLQRLLIRTREAAIHYGIKHCFAALSCTLVL